MAKKRPTPEQDRELCKRVLVLARQHPRNEIGIDQGDPLSRRLRVFRILPFHPTAVAHGSVAWTRYAIRLCGPSQQDGVVE